MADQESPGYVQRMNIIPLAAFCFLSADAAAKIPANHPIDIVAGESIARLKIGMELRRAMKVVPDLKPEGTKRGPDRSGYVSGALLVIVDQSSRVVTISVDLPQSPGLRAGKTIVPPQANLDQIKQLLPGCELSNGSGGRVLECEGSKGKMHFYDSFGDPKAVWAILP